MAAILALILSIFLLTSCVPLLVTSAATKTVSVAHDRRSTGTIVDDASIEFKAKGKLATYPFNYESHITVTSYNNNVLLTGQTPRHEYAEQMQRDIQKIANVNKVFNQLEIAKPTSFKQRTKDSYTTTKVKAKLLTNKQIDPTRIKVTTENNTVYLLGIVTQKEADVATEIARNVSGVQRVTKAFEYMQN